AQDHAEDGEGAAQLVGAQSVQRLLQVFAIGLCHRLPQPSERSASMGSSFAARIAGKIPKKRPTAVDRHKDNMTALIGVSMGNEKTFLTKKTTAYAPMIPMIPPTAARTADSVMNCSKMCFFLRPASAANRFPGCVRLRWQA